MSNFKQGGKGFGGGRGERPSFGGRDGGRPSFGKKSFSGKGFPSEMHKAICSECGKSCEVPFRPTAGKPVYCKDCFGSKGAPSGDRFPRKDFGERAPLRANFEETKVVNNNSEVLKKLDSLHVKIDQLTQLVHDLSKIQTKGGEEVAKEEVSEPKVKKAKKTK